MKLITRIEETEKKIRTVLSNPPETLLKEAKQLIAAIKNSRRGMVIDRDSQYIELTKKRISAFQNGILKIRPLGKPAHKPTGKEKVAQMPSEWMNVNQYRNRKY